MARSAGCRGALHVAWKLTSADADSAGSLQQCLAAGHRSKVYTLRSVDIRDGIARAVLKPEAPLEDIADLFWMSGHEPVALAAR